MQRRRNQLMWEVYPPGKKTFARPGVRNVRITTGRNKEFDIDFKTCWAADCLRVQVLCLVLLH
jgi:hypothetical protein